MTTELTTLGSYRLIERINGNHHFIDMNDVKNLLDAGNTRLRKVLVRCGCGRFLCPLQDVQHFIEIIDRDRETEPDRSKTDYIRDVSLFVGDWPEFGI